MNKISSTQGTSQDSPDSTRSTRYAWYVVVVLTVANISSNIDRIIMHLLVEPMKRDLHISDTQMSLLMGFSFALLYAVLGIPLGRMADNRSRRTVIGVGIALWSMMTAFCGMARLYWQLFLARIGVGVGEATLAPSAYSMIADYFPKDKLASALSFYSIGIYIGAGLAQILGGAVVQFASSQATWTLPVLGEVYSWQTVFFVIGLPGLAVAALMVTVREPKRQGVIDVVGTSTSVAIRDVLRYVGEHNRTFVLMCAGCGFFALFSYSASAWIPSLFMRNYGWSPGKFGVIYGTIIMTLGTLGSLFGGWLADRLSRRGYTDAKLRVVIVAAIGLFPCVVVYPLMPTPELCLLLLLPINIFAGMPWGPAAAAIQEVLPNQMRGLGSALYLFILSMIGLALGPTSVALLNDYVFHDPLAVRYSLAIVNASAVAGSAFLLVLALKPFQRTAQSLQTAVQAPNG